jgi:hypothetical protein
MDPDQTARISIHAGRKRSMLVLSWCGSNIIVLQSMLTKQHQSYLVIYHVYINVLTSNKQTGKDKHKQNSYYL